MMISLNISLSGVRLNFSPNLVKEYNLFVRMWVVVGVFVGLYMVLW